MKSSLKPLHRAARRSRPFMAVKALMLLLALLPACMHHIQVNPHPATPASATIPRSLKIALGPLSLEGADHMPGITLLRWPRRDLRQAVLGYVKERGTFSSVSTDDGELTLGITTKLALASRQGRYQYRIFLQGEMSEASRPIKTYLVEHMAIGSQVRWVTASDRDPIEAALQSALDDMLIRIEDDRMLYTTSDRAPSGTP